MFGSAELPGHLSDKSSRRKNWFWWPWQDWERLRPSARARTSTSISSSRSHRRASWSCWTIPELRSIGPSPRLASRVHVAVGAERVDEITGAREPV